MIGDPFTIRCIVVCVILFVIFGLLAYALIDDYEDWRHWHKVWKDEEARTEKAKEEKDGKTEKPEA